MERRVKFRGRETRTTTRNETGEKSKKKKWEEKRERASCPGARRDTVRVHEQADPKTWFLYLINYI